MKLRRRAFLAGLAGIALAAPVAAQTLGSGGDRSQALRVLLGRGSVEPVPGGFLFAGNRYRGNYRILADGRVVNEVDFDDYLASVVPSEMSAGWPTAALEAQAICSRGFILARSNPNRAYDVVPSELAQVYRGVESEHPASTAAVRETSGLVLRYANGFAQIEYSSCCGGFTESSADAWGAASIPYLIAHPCPYCTASPNYRWSADLGAATLGESAGRIAPQIGLLQEVTFVDFDRSGRARSVALGGVERVARIPASRFRIDVGARRVPSLLVRRQKPLFAPGTQAFAGLHIEGRGLGHGVGLCQWGARGYALAGGSAQEILSFYFAGTSIGRI
ncbi:MAG: SpoIID/LytB domain-containing protein [Candidatus Eremiobacteraeota bacterium]|uniref:Sporulation stage II protein D amidase enhancer LytB N-terminal domain-containing protein n=1 Tax=mine drainage metagenome TaxID=410659 RepID=E6PDW4_9ZZZZ|nr:SpoIID/LytB domain-containing protein [Candidatus Eremiobacteraeota bacterium]